MSAVFVPCAMCRRHVRAGDACPYCATVATSNVVVPGRGSRSAFLLATALVAASAEVGCRDDKSDKVTIDEPRRPKDPAFESAQTSDPKPPAPTPSPTPSASNSDLAIGIGTVPPSPTGIGIGAAYGGPPPAAYGGPPPTSFTGIAPPAPAAYGIAPPTVTMKGPTAEASVGAATVSGMVTNADSVIARNRWRFKACYGKALMSDPTAEGKVTLRLTVDDSGAVTKTQVVSTTLSSALASCVAAAPNGFLFETKGGSSTVTFTVVLSPKK